MTADEQSHYLIERMRTISRKAADVYVTKGIAPIDIAIASIYAAHDIAMVATRTDAPGAIEWLRTAIDTMERQLLTSFDVTSDGPKG